MLARASIRICDAPFDPEEEARAFRLRCAGSGAIVSFVGLVRAVGEETRLILEHYAPLTRKAVEAIAEEALGRWPLDAIAIAHRVGEMRAGEPIVFAAAASAHRRAAFEAADFLMDHLKSAAPFWKKERAGDRDRWIEPTESDHRDLARWSLTPKETPCTE